ncbi:MAG: translation initiation factor [Blastocatellia bacterium]|jgi:translation initiation factor IF-2|nr:translation initiation factor [Blastocatellia bacterium]
MSAVTSKVRIYDLAKDLKIDTKRLIEEVRREGVDVSVPSNSISKELAEKIRDKYFPKKDTAVKRTVKIVKKAARPVVEEAPPELDEEVVPPIEAAEPETVAAEEPATFTQAPSTHVVRKLSPALRAEKPPEPEVSVHVSEVPEDNSAPVPLAAEAASAEPERVEPAPAAPPSRQVRVLRPTAAALNAGIRHGERAPAPAPPPPAPAAAATAVRERGRERAPRGRVEYAGTPGETATPQTTYIPPPDAGRRRSRRGSSRSGKRPGEGKGGRFDRDFIPPPQALTLEQRIAGRMDSTSGEGELKPVRLVEGSTVKEFAEKLGIKPKDVVALLLQRGIFATINQALEDEVAAELGQRFGYEVSFVPFEEMIAEEEFEELIATDADDVEVPRAPVVTVMGHVDHGKTSLLDAIRTTNVAGGEAGGITQHIGAYSVQVPSPDNPAEKRRVVFLDTPGHEAFTLMRARGAKATDVVVLVVAADDGVMPQTIEAIEHSRAAGVPIVVAINKIDKPDANPDRVRQELSVQGLNPVEWGGETEMVQVSAKKRENIENLLETILLTSDILNLRASTTRLASGVVLEAKLDRGRGAVATALVQQGTLHIGDPFIVGQIFGKVRAMFNDRGEAVTEAGPATPVEVLGLQGVPQAGETFQVVADVTRAQQISGHRQAAERQRTLIKSTKRGIEALGETEVKELLVVLKADVQGSVEVLKATLQKMSSERVKVKVVRSGVGAITESDVLLASATQAGSSSTAVVIIGFNVRPESRTGDLAKQEGVDIRLHSIIYKVEEEIKAAMIGMLDKIEREKILGKAEIREVFRVPKIGAVAGCMVIDGIMKRNARARLIRDSVVAWEGNIISLRRFKDDASEVREGFECGIGLENFNDIKVGDQIEAYVIEKVAATEL